MRRFSYHRRLAVLGCCAAAFLSWMQATAQDRPEPVAAIFPVQDRAGDQEAAFAVALALRGEFENRADVVDPGRVRSALRRFRVRDGDAATIDTLSRLAAELESSWLVVPTLHDSERKGVPSVTISARVYEASSGRLSWVGFEAASGLDSEKALGIGIIRNTEDLATRVAVRMLEDLWERIDAGDFAGGSSRHPSSPELGRVALVAMDSITEKRTTANAGTLTEAARAVLFRSGVQLVEPRCATGAARRTQAGKWGGVGTELREALRRSCDADLIVTGAVEAYDFTTFRGTTTPRVAVALRVLDPVTGQILWLQALDRTGQDTSGLFRVGRVYSGGALAERLTETLIRRLFKDWPPGVEGQEEKGWKQVPG